MTRYVEISLVYAVLFEHMDRTGHDARRLEKDSWLNECNVCQWTKRAWDDFKEEDRAYLERKVTQRMKAFEKRVNRED